MPVAVDGCGFPLLDTRARHGVDGVLHDSS